MREMITPNDITSLPVGTVINGRHGRWTLLGTPYASHPSTRDGSPVYRAMALWEGKGGPKTVTLTFAASDVYGRGIGAPPIESGDGPEAGWPVGVGGTPLVCACATCGVPFVAFDLGDGLERCESCGCH